MIPLLLLIGVGGFFVVKAGIKSKAEKNPPDRRVPVGWVKRERFCDKRECGWAYYYTNLDGKPATVLVPDYGEIEIVRM